MLFLSLSLTKLTATKDVGSGQQVGKTFVRTSAISDRREEHWQIEAENVILADV